MPMAIGSAEVPKRTHKRPNGGMQRGSRNTPGHALTGTLVVCSAVAIGVYTAQTGVFLVALAYGATGDGETIVSLLDAEGCHGGAARDAHRQFFAVRYRGGIYDIYAVGRMIQVGGLTPCTHYLVAANAVRRVRLVVAARHGREEQQLVRAKTVVEVSHSTIASLDARKLCTTYTQRRQRDLDHGNIWAAAMEVVVRLSNSVARPSLT